jgi:hypothetical protein
MISPNFEKWVNEGGPVVQEFRPVASYDADGDCIEFFATNENFYARRVDSFVTAYYSMETNEVVGSLIKGVSKIFRQAVKKAPGFKIEVEGHRIKLEYVFTACLWSAKRDANGLEVVIYKKLRRVATLNDVEVEAGALA